ncbi:hypothetical protein CORC01_14391 [Colletotrichum orchidophilum]|uniref:Uncharacterized protein n=1 Tax=Colletotrichum orchidophilum TaxID=1209926 RepID=A0A1G4AMA8_9PEZI|nr:uncharacterized protein CORC01_14391 [Colletotrichum orchidophilum]OHE90304.1 hypothetical protein CORC01_14391 [Colletotrichum orchidophilum]
MATMTDGLSPKNKVDTREKRAKDKVRKSGPSAQGKALQLGEFAGVFSAVVYFNPTYGWLDGAIHVPEGQDIPDVNGFLEELLNGSHSTGPGRGPRRAKTCRDSKISHHENPQAAKDTDGGRQLDRRLADGLALQSASRCVAEQEMPNGAAADEMGGNEAQNGQSGDVSEWETVDAQHTEAPTARVAGPGLSRIQAVKVQRFLRQVSVHMRLASRQERLPPHRVVHQDRWRGLLQRNRRR